MIATSFEENLVRERYHDGRNRPEHGAPAPPDDVVQAVESALLDV